MSDKMNRLPDAELEVMQALWACEGPAESSLILHHMKRAVPIAPTTLLTLLGRLEGKGFLRMEKQGRLNRYIPLIEEKQYLSEQSRSFLERLFGGNLSAFAVALCESGLSSEEIEELRDLLKKGEL